MLYLFFVKWIFKVLNYYFNILILCTTWVNYVTIINFYEFNIFLVIDLNVQSETTIIKLSIRYIVHLDDS